MTQFDASKYTDSSTPVPRPTSISRSVQPDKEKLSPVGVGLTVLTIGAIAVSFGSSIPGMMQQTKIEAAVSQRLQADGISKMSDGDAAIALKTALPLVHPDTNKLEIVTWESVIQNNNFPPGVYFGSNLLIKKGLNGRGNGTPSDQYVSNHAIANISPEQAYKRYNEVKKEMGLL